MNRSLPHIHRHRIPLYLGMAIIMLALFLPGCAGSGHHSRGGVLRIKGSDTMLLLARRWAEEYMRLRPDVAVYVEGGGSALGIRALIDGEVDLCTASRTLRAEEAQRLIEKQGSLGLSVLTARDALSVYLHPDNPVRNLTQAQLRGLFTGSITSWDQIGGQPIPVKVISRSPNSGTYLFFEEHVLDGSPYTEASQIVPTTMAVIQQVRSDPGAIGYGGGAFSAGVIHASVDDVAPTRENVMNGTYPISRYLYLYTAAVPNGLIKDFIDWTVGSEGQKIVSEIGYIPLWETSEK